VPLLRYSVTFRSLRRGALPVPEHGDSADRALRSGGPQPE
jgi:hypothetical protein